MKMEKKPWERQARPRERRTRLSYGAFMQIGSFVAALERKAEMSQIRMTPRRGYKEKRCSLSVKMRNRATSTFSKPSWKRETALQM